MSEWVLGYIATSVLFYPVGLQFGWFAAAMVCNAVFIVWFAIRVRLR
jgi:hypothetical protein